MIQNSLKIAFRSFKKNALFTSFNLVSLVTSILVIYIAIAYLNFETSYDKFHKNSDSIYRLAATLRSQDYSIIGFQNWNSSEGEEQINQITKLSDLPGVKSATHFITTADLEYVRFNEKEIKVKDVLYTNTPRSFTELFTWDIKYGSFTDFYNNQNSVILTESVANVLLKENNYGESIQQTVNIGGENYAIAAIIEDVPGNSHFDFSVAIHTKHLDYWGSHVYLQAQNGVSQSTIEAQIKEARAAIFPNTVDNPTFKKHFLQPVADIHLKSNILYELKPPGNINYVLLIGGFAVFILCICVFNYSNFTFALKSKQSRTIGIKKVIGASRSSVARQFVFEGILLSMIAALLAIILLPFAIPVFNELMGVSLEFDPANAYRVYVTILLLAAAIGIVSSILPAFKLSGMSAMSLFQDRLKEKSYQEFSVRKYLIISQFVIIIGITAISYFIQGQVDFIANKDLGFNKENILYANTSPENLDVFQQKLRQIPEVETVANGSSLAIGTYNQLTYKIEGEETIFDDANQLYMDYAALKAYGLEISLSESILNDSENQPRRTIINRTAANKLADIKNITTNELIGLTIITEPEFTDEEGNVGFPFTIDGIFEDINLFSLREKIQPYFIVVSNSVRMYGMSIIALRPGTTASGLEKIQNAYNELNEPFPLEVQFLDSNYKALHAEDKQMGSLVFVLNSIAIFLALLGIIGITLLLIISRTKEIGIRKVLGASVASILKISVKEYIGFIVLATLIAWPISIFVVKNWLSNFAYRIEINQLAIVGVALLVLVGTIFIVGLVSFKAAMANPVKSLRTE